ncbi:hypothetical protein BF49_2461 [Bradyrhizobium sp.]|nr:hypothetical protein BF49_2461 [Bradyrhizobium sp.]
MQHLRAESHPFAIIAFGPHFFDAVEPITAPGADLWPGVAQ